MSSKKLNTLSTMSIGIGGMVGGGIFAVTGLSIEITRSGAPLAFIIAGVVALLTSYSYLRLTLRVPGEGGTVTFLNRAFGGGILTGASCILLLLSYVVLLSVYAYTFGTYAANVFPPEHQLFWQRIFTTGVILGLLALNLLKPELVIRYENTFNLIKLVLLGLFVLVGFMLPMDWSRLTAPPDVPLLSLIAGAMLIFLNYEGFELIANASNEVKDPEKSLPIAYLGGVLLVIIIYVLIAAVVIGHMSYGAVAQHQDTVLSATAHAMAGTPGYLVILGAALLATASAINATFFSTGRMAYIVAKTGELPPVFERTINNQHAEGSIVCAVLALYLANFVSLNAIATMGSAGFLLIFMAVNIANVRLARETQSKAWLSALAALSTAVALVVLCAYIGLNPETRSQLWVLVGMVVISLAIEIVYRKMSEREIRLTSSGKQ